MIDITAIKAHIICNVIENQAFEGNNPIAINIAAIKLSSWYKYQFLILLVDSNI